MESYIVIAGREIVRHILCPSIESLTVSWADARKATMDEESERQGFYFEKEIHSAFSIK